MAGPLTPGTKILARLYEPDAEDLLPKPVDRHAGRQRVSILIGRATMSMSTYDCERAPRVERRQSSRRAVRDESIMSYPRVNSLWIRIPRNSRGSSDPENQYTRSSACP